MNPFNWVGCRANATIIIFGCLGRWELTINVIALHLVGVRILLHAWPASTVASVAGIPMTPAPISGIGADVYQRDIRQEQREKTVE